MERMIRKKKDNSDYEIDRELTGKFAIEKNAEYQEKIEQLEEENKKLKMSEKRYKNQYDFDEECLRKLKEENKNLKEENEKLKYNNKLYKEMIDKIQIAYIKFEEATDEKYKAFRKAYGDLDQVIMNR